MTLQQASTQIKISNSPLGPITKKRLNLYGISDQDNTLPSGRRVFDSLYYNSFKQESKRLDQDNTSILFTDLQGNPIQVKQDGARWKFTYKRIRRADCNRFNYVDDSGEIKKLSKYVTKTGVKNIPFFTGLYVYFVKPLQDQYGTDTTACHKELTKLFKSIVFTEGEYKAFAACKAGIPCIGLVGVFGATKAIKKKAEQYDQHDKTIDAFFTPTVSAFLSEYQTKSISLLHDSDALDNTGRPDRALNTFYSSVKHFKFATDNHNKTTATNTRLKYFIINSFDGEKLGIDDLLHKHPGKAKADQIRKQLTGSGKGMFFQSTKVEVYNGKTQKERNNLNIIYSKFVKSYQDTTRYLPTYYPEKYGTFKRYIGQSDHLDNIILECLSNHKTILNIPPNSGKSFLTYRHLEKAVKGKYTDYVIINLSPLQKLTAQQSSDAINKHKDLNYTTVCTDYESAKSVSLDCQKYNVTLQSFKTLAPRLDDAGVFDDKKIVIVFDEISEKYRGTYQDNYLLDKYLDKAAHVIGLTATNYTIPSLHDGFKIIQLDRIQNPKININLRLTTGSNYKSDVCSWITSQAGKNNLVFVPGTDDTHYFDTYCKKTGIKSEAYHAQLTESKKAKCTAVAGLIDNGKLTDGYTLLTTKALELGINAANLKNVCLVLKPGQFDQVNTIQSYFRDRGIVINLTVFVQYQNRWNFSNAKFDFDQEQFNHVYNKAVQLCDTLNQNIVTAENLGCKIDQKELTQCWKFTRTNDLSKYIKFDDTSNRYFVYKDAIWSEQIQHINQSYELTDLIQWFRNTPNSTLTIFTDQPEPITAAVELAEQTKESKTNFKDLFVSLMTDPDTRRHVTWFAYKESKDDKIKRSIKKQQPKIWDEAANGYLQQKNDLDTFLKLPCSLKEISTTGDALTTHFKDVLKYLNRFYSFQRIGNGLFAPSFILDTIFLSDNEYGNTRRRISALQAIEIVKHFSKKDIGTLSLVDKDFYLAAITAKFDTELIKLIDTYLDNGCLESFKPFELYTDHKFTTKYTGAFSNAKQINNYLKNFYIVSSGKRSQSVKTNKYQPLQLDTVAGAGYTDSMIKRVKAYLTKVKAQKRLKPLNNSTLPMTKPLSEKEGTILILR